MYALSLSSGGRIGSADIQRALADLPFECGSESHKRRMQWMGEIERLGARGARYSNEDFDVLSGALNFIDAVAPEVSDRMRSSARVVVVDYAYPTSDHAERYGFYHEGCYVVKIGCFAVAGFPTLPEARQHAEQLGLPLHPAMNEGWRAA